MTTPVNNGATYLPTAGEGKVPQWNGVYAGTVINNHDPLGVGRLQLNVPQVLGDAVSAWAVPAGTYYALPTNGTPVSVTFLGGDPAQPLWAGPLDLNPLVEAAAGPNVTYSISAPPNPKVGDIWYPLVNGVQGPPAVWTFNAMTSTYSWVTQPGVGSYGAAGNFLVYSGTPALGNLIGSISGAATTDSLTNIVVRGINAYQVVGGINYAIGLNQALSSTLGSLPGMSVEDTANPPYSPAGFFSVSSNGTVKQAAAGLTSGQVTSADVASVIYATSQTKSGVTNGTIQISAGQTFIGNNGTLTIDDRHGYVVLESPQSSTPPAPLGWAYYADANGDPAIILESGEHGTIPLTQAIQGGNTNNTTSMNAMFTPFSIQSFDSQNNTVYRITCGGHGTQATTTAVALNFQLAAFGQTWGASADTGGIAAGDNFHWRFTGELIVNSNGAASFTGLMVMSQATASAQGHPTAMDQQVASGTLSYTSNTTITFQAGWASVTNSPTLVCTGAVFERLGA